MILRRGRRLLGAIAAVGMVLSACGDTSSTAVPAPTQEVLNGSRGPAAELLGLPLAKFIDRAAELGLGPVRIGWQDGEFVPVTEDLSPGRVTVAVDTSSGEEIVIDATVEENDASADLRPEAMVVTPDEVALGQVFEVTYPGGRDRGVGYVLEIVDGDSWRPTHLMTASAEGYDGGPSWIEFDAESYGFDAVGVSGAGPDSLIVPDTAEPGRYRLCTANSVQNICTPLTVIDGPTEPPVATGAASDDASSDGRMAIDESEVLLGDVVEVSFPGGLERGPVYLLERSVDDTWVTTHVMTAWNETAGDVAPMWFDIGDEPDVLPSGVVDGVGPDQLRIPDNVEGGLHRICTDGTAEVVCVELTIGPVGTEITLAPSDDVASIVSVTDDVAFYPACGNETLELAETSWYVVGHIGYRPFQENLVRLVEQIEATPREPLPAVSPRGIVRVAPPGPGDDIGTLVVWSDGVARWTSESGTIDVWMIDEPIERNWDC